MAALALPTPGLRQALFMDCVFSALAAAFLWAIVVIEAWPRLMAGRTLCGGEPTFLGHCPACLPAIAATLMAAGFAIALSALNTRERAHP